MTHAPSLTMDNTENGHAATASMRYVAFCDVLGFGNAVQERFEETIEIYDQFTRMIGEWPFPEKVEICVYSDSILILSDELAPLLQAVQSLSFATLSHDLLIRGGIAYGKYWERRERGNLFVVSDALVRAVKLESRIKIPGVGFSPEVEIPVSAWMPHFADEIFLSPILHFRDITVVNPFNKFWFASARSRVAEMLNRFPEHSKKYEWFLELSAAVERRDVMVPSSVIDFLLAEGVIKRRPVEEKDINRSDDF
ncbi:hypothetical protein [Polaromonas sp. A23]|uniref:hypothetical protein n=1 Tax=Polaromonas sp. A23 TaxID=1944133 RepID=UPI000984D7B5|nr:hypothetical protein [Polaromonas sp. A23]OOG45011.1 hypothetical protein B0B52_04455 [Polaromonas sp. A23]